MCIKKNILVMGLVLAFAGLIAGFFAADYLKDKQAFHINEFHGTYLEHPRSVNAFSLQGTDSKTFNNESLEGRWTMIFFGFTSCGYLCPTTMAEMGKMYKILEKNGVKNLPQVVMITLDPERDPLNKLTDYVQTFDPHFYGAIGDQESIKHMTREMGVMYAKVSMQDPADPKAYDIQHSGTIMLFNPEGKLNAFFTTPHHGAILAQDYQLLVG